jgi:alpha-L-fucosidase
MIDVWSKKGIVLLNISPKADGTIPQEQQEVLMATGEWIEKHKEAVYETRTYTIYGYGKAKIDDGEFGGQSATIQYSENDFRFMVSKDKKSLYVFSLGLPAANTKLEISHIDPSSVKKVTVVGSGAELTFSLTNNALTIETPGASQMYKIATVFKIELE